MAISMACGIYFLVRRGRAIRADEDDVYNLALLVILGGVIGARLVYVLTNWHDFALAPGDIWRIDQGGLSIHGALFGGLCAGLWYAARRRLRFWALTDGFVPGACIGIFLVRIGNIFNGEILGRTSILLGGARHPAQVYEMVMALVLWFQYWRGLRRSPADGVLFWNFVFWYSIMRFVSEMFRDNPLYIIQAVSPLLGVGMVTLTQWFTPLILGVAWSALRWRRAVDVHSARLSAPAARTAAVAAAGAAGSGSDG